VPYLLCCTDVMCYACNSYMAQCNFDKLATNTNNNVFQARCTSKCFTRQGEDEGIFIYILFISGNMAQVTQKHTNQPQTHNLQVGDITLAKFFYMPRCSLVPPTLSVVFQFLLFRLMIHLIRLRCLPLPVSG